MQGASRVADLKLLSKERWEAHVEAQQALAAKTGAAFEPGPMPTPTAGALFNRPNPRNDKGEFVLPYVRSRDEFVPFRGERMWVDADGFHTERPENPKDWKQTRKYVAVSGKVGTAHSNSPLLSPFSPFLHPGRRRRAVLHAAPHFASTGLDGRAHRVAHEVPYSPDIGRQQGWRHQVLPLLRLPPHRRAMECAALTAQTMRACLPPPVARAIAAHGRALSFSQFGGSTSSA